MGKGRDRRKKNKKKAERMRSASACKSLVISEEAKGLPDNLFEQANQIGKWQVSAEQIKKIIKAHPDSASATALKALGVDLDDSTE